MTEHILTTWLLTYAVHGALFAALAAVAERTGWGAPASRRDAFWKLALVGGVVSATVFVVIGSAPSGAVVRVPAGVALATEDEAAAIPWVAMVWIVVTAAMALRSVLDWRTGVRSAGRRRVIRRGAARAALDTILGPGAERAALTCSRSLGVPVAFRREICVPIRALRELPHDELRALLAHEAAHVLRRDTGWLVASAVVRTLGWWQPLNFVAAARLRLAMELCCDERAATTQPERAALARCLVKVAEWNVHDDAGVFAAMGSSGSALRRRLVSLLDETPPRRQRRPGSWAVIAVAVPAIWLAPLITIANVTRLPEAAARFVPRTLAATTPVSVQAPPAPAARPPRRTEPARAVAARVGPVLPADGVGEGNPHAEDAALAGAAFELSPIEPSAAPAPPMPAPAPTTLRATIATVRVAPAPPPPEQRFGEPERERRMLNWVAGEARRHSFDPNHPTYGIR